MLSGSVKREKVGTFSLSFLAVSLTFYDILAAPNYLRKLKLSFVNLTGSKALSWREVGKNSSYSVRYCFLGNSVVRKEL